MKNNLIHLAISCLVGGIIIGFSLNAYAQTSPPTAQVTVNADRTSYALGDMIVISGSVKPVVPDTPLVFQILDPNNILVQVGEFDVSQDGSFSGTVKAVGALWKSSGPYLIRVQYGPPDESAQTTFAFRNFVTPTNGVFRLMFPSDPPQTFSINYTIAGAKINDMKIDTYNSTRILFVSINSTTDGYVTLQMPRTLLDAKSPIGQDAEFYILIDGTRVIPQSESSDKNFRDLTIPFFEGDQNIAIAGFDIILEASSPTSNVFSFKEPSSQQTLNLNYTMNGGTVKTVTIDTRISTLHLYVNSISDGGITVQIPRTLIDAKTTSGQDDTFIILIDGAEVKPQSETADNNFRNLTIPLLKGSKDIEIIGTQTIPEFSALAGMIMAISIIGVIAVSRRFRFHF